MTAAMTVLAVTALLAAGLSVVSYLRSRRTLQRLESRAEKLHQSSLALEWATDRALATLVNPEPTPTTGEIELDGMLRQLTRAQSHLDEFAPQIAFSTWDRAQARRVVEQARATGALSDGDVDYIDVTRRLGSEITHDGSGKRKLLAGY